MYLGVCFLGSNFFGTLWASWTCRSTYFAWSGKFFLHYFFKWVFNFLLFLFSFWHPYDSDVGTFKVVLEVPNPLLIFLNSYFFILIWLNVYFFLLLQIIDLSPGFLPITVDPCIFSFISLCIAFTFSSILWAYSTISVSILITSVLNPASDRLAISSLLSCIFFWSFDLFFHLGHVFFFWSQCAC